MINSRLIWVQAITFKNAKLSIINCCPLVSINSTPEGLYIYVHCKNNTFIASN